MISRQHRFHGHASLGYVYRHGHTVRDQLLAIRYAPNPKRQTYRAAVIVSRKVHKSAVLRNRIRRRLYELIRLSEPAMTGPYDIVLTVFHERVSQLKPQELHESVSHLLAKSGIAGHSAKRPAVSVAPTHGIVKPREETS